MLASFGIEMVTVDDARRRARHRRPSSALVRDDPSIKGIWIVPTYANPSGAVVTQEVAARLAAMPTAAPDFKIFWDNAYAFHHLTEDEAKSADILSLCAAVRPPEPADHVRLDLQDHLRRRRRGRSSRLSRGQREVVPRPPRQWARSDPTRSTTCGTSSSSGRRTGVRAHMRRHREIIAPKFAAVDAGPDRAGSTASTSPSGRHPTGGYFVNLDVLDGTASRVVALAKEAGIALTPAGVVLPARATTRATATSASRRPSRCSTRCARPWPAWRPASPSPPPRS